MGICENSGQIGTFHKTAMKGPSIGFRYSLGSISSADTRSCYEHIREMQQETPARLEETAKFLSGVIFLAPTLFLTVRFKYAMLAAGVVLFLIALAILVRLFFDAETT